VSELAVTKYGCTCDFNCDEVGRASSQQEIYRQRALDAYGNTSCAVDDSMAIRVEQSHSLRLKNKAR